jgi:hypothetical protein
MRDGLFDSHAVDLRNSNIVTSGDTPSVVHVLELRMCHRGLRHLGDEVLTLARVEQVEEESSPALAWVVDEGIESTVRVETSVGANGGRLR